MSNTPGLVDIHVLEETVSRVLTLTQSISNQADGIIDSSRKSQRALGPKSGPNRNLGLYTKNVNSVLDIYGEIEKDARRLAELQRPIEAGPAKVGLNAYIDFVHAADALALEFANSKTYRTYPALIERSRKVRQRGIDRLQRLVGRLAATVYDPVDGTQYLDSSEPLPPVSPEDLDTLGHLLAVLDRYPETQGRTDEQLIDVMEKYMSQSLEGARTQLSETNANGNMIKAFGLLCEDVKGVLNDSVKTLFGSQDPERANKLTALTAQLSKREMSKFTSGIAGSGAGSSDARTGPVIAAGPPSATQRSPQRGSASADQGRPGPHGLPKIVTEPPNGAGTTNGRSSDSPGAANRQTPTASTGSNGPGGFGMTNSPGGLGSPSSATTQAGAFTIFDIIESARVTPIADEDLARYKRDGLATLSQVLTDIEQRCKRSPVTSEFAVSPASIQFMQTLKSVSSVGRGIEIVLSEVPTRGYVAQPHPQWAIKSEPTPEGRANPLSQYYADCIECLYSTLHRLAAETFKNSTKTGIFMLSNLAAIEHYITDSNTDTIASTPRKSPLMLALGPVAIQRFQRLMENPFKEYLTEWRSLAPHLMEPTVTSSAAASGGKLSGKDREAVKEKFRQFNAEFEVLVERQKKYQVADPTLRARMTKEVKALIGPLYYRFYDKHCGGDFTKNLDKYIKWNKEQFDQAIEF